MNPKKPIDDKTSNERRPLRGNYDVFMDVVSELPSESFCYALIKQTFMIKNGECILTDPIALEKDFKKEQEGARLLPGTDYWPYKEKTDIVIQGSAYNTERSTSTSKNQVDVSFDLLGKHLKFRKSIRVFGDRFIEWKNGLAEISPAKPFESIPLSYSNAYGGIDWRVPIEDEFDNPLELEFKLQYDHPGVYPRNPHGKGYLVYKDRVDGMQMPNLEDPKNLLSTDNIFAGSPQNWYRQPLPWCFDWVHPLTFPRYIFFEKGVDAWYPGPEDDQMLEVQNNYIPSFYRSNFKKEYEDLFKQEASFGMSFADEDVIGSKILLSGMHHLNSSFSFVLPKKIPEFSFFVETRKITVTPKLHSVVIFPDKHKLTLLWGGQIELPKIWLPKIHKNIPVSISIDGDSNIDYSEFKP